MGASARVRTPGVAAVAVPLEEARLSQLEPLTRLAVQFTVELESPRLRTSTLRVAVDPPPAVAWNKTPDVFTARIGPLEAIKSDTGISAVPEEEETRMVLW